MASNFLLDIKLTEQFSDVWLEPLRILPLIEDYEHLPIVAFDKAVQPIQSLVPELDRMIWIVQQRCQQIEGNLTYNESASIMLYSIEWTPKENSFHHLFNQILRSDNRQLLKPWLLYFKLLLTSYSKLPTKSISKVYRSVSMNLSSKYLIGSTCIWWGFSSCTMSEEYVDQFYNETGQRTLFQIDCQTGKDIHQHTFFPKQQVLFLPARQFEIIDNYQENTNLCVIHLKEIEPYICFLKHLSTVDTLLLRTRSMSDYTNSKLEHFIDHFKACSEIKLANLNLNDHDMDIIIQQAINNKNCTELSLNNNQITCRGAFILGSILYNNTTLKKLVLAKNSIGDLSIKSFIEQYNYKGIQYFSEMLKTNQILRSLWLNGNEISDEGVHSLMNSLAFHNTSLKFLRLSSDQTISDACIDSIIDMVKHNTTLNYLDIQHCNLSSTGKLLLEKNVRSKKDFYLDI
ncbi:hypothetical protein I4U23_019783 [Adineta vaga]|nr:hypothetical protein I4U23_019783 [Adineta vaga]